MTYNFFAWRKFKALNSDFQKEENISTKDDVYTVLNEYSLASGVNAITGTYLSYDAFTDNEFLDKSKLANDFDITVFNANSTELLDISETTINKFALGFSGKYSKSSGFSLGLSSDSIFGFSSTLSKRFSVNSEFKIDSETQEYYYMSYQLISDKSRGIKNFSKDKISKGDYFSDFALSELKKISEASGVQQQKLVSNFFATFGTHIVTGAVYGGKIEFYYYCLDNDSEWNLDAGLNITRDISAELNASYEGDKGTIGETSGSELDLKLGLSDSNSSIATNFYATASGGEALDKYTFKDFSQGYADWIKSYNSRQVHNTMIDIKSNGLCPIWEILPVEYSNLKSLFIEECEKYLLVTNGEFLSKFDKDVVNNTVDYAGGAGTIYNPYLISEPIHLRNIEKNMDAYFELINDINLSGYKNWDPISGSFTGLLDGNGFKITNLSSTISKMTAEINVGLFKENKGIIQELELENCNLKVSPEYEAINVTINCGAVAAKNSGKILNCNISNSLIVANTSNIAEVFLAKFNNSFKNFTVGKSNEWKQWITQDYNSASSDWKREDIKLSVYSGGVVGFNSGLVDSCSFSGTVEGNLYNMHVTDGYIQKCYTGGVAAYNTSQGSINNCNISGNVSAWCELVNDAAGMGWVGDIYPTAYVYSGGVAGYSENNSIYLKDEFNVTVSLNVRHYAPQYVFLAGAGYDTSTKSHDNNITKKSDDLYNS